jgi:hypothetical protein
MKNHGFWKFAGVAGSDRVRSPTFTQHLQGERFDHALKTNPCQRCTQGWFASRWQGAERDSAPDSESAFGSVVGGREAELADPVPIEGDDYSAAVEAIEALDVVPIPLEHVEAVPHRPVLCFHTHL